MKSFVEFLVESYKYKAQKGESEVLHHLTANKFDTFKSFSHFGTANAARSRAFSKPKVSNDTRKSDNMYSVRIKKGKTVDVDDLGTNTPQDLAVSLHKRGHISTKEKKYVTGSSSKSDAHHNLLDVLKARKIKTMRYKNEFEDPGKHSYIITHPDQVRVLRKKEHAKINLEKGEKHTSPDVFGESKG